MPQHAAQPSLPRVHHPWRPLETTAIGHPTAVSDLECSCSVWWLLWCWCCGVGVGVGVGVAVGVAVVVVRTFR